MTVIDITDIEAARDRLERDPELVKRTSVEYSRSLSAAIDGNAYLEMEHLQWTGSFKTREAYNEIARLVGTRLNFGNRAAEGVQSLLPTPRRRCRGNTTEKNINNCNKRRVENHHQNLRKLGSPDCN